MTRGPTAVLLRCRSVQLGRTVVQAPLSVRYARKGHILIQRLRSVSIVRREALAEEVTRHHVCLDTGLRQELQSA